MKLFSPTDLLNRSSLYVALLAAWIAMLGSLYFSEVKGYLPCDLCWYQRILMYPLTVLLAVGLLRQDANLPFLVLPLSVIGQGFSTYHYLLEKTDLFSAPTACRTGVPCTVLWINWFGFITIPFLAMIAFFIITIMCLIAITAGEPDELANRPSPWFQVGGVIVAVVAAFALLTWYTAEPAQSLALTPVSGAEQTPVATAVPTLAAAGDAAQGAEIYQQSCAVCHGQDAHGMPNLGGSLVDSEIVDTYSDADIVALVRSGIDINNPINQTGVPMPPSAGRPSLTDEQILAIVNWVRTLH